MFSYKNIPKQPIINKNEDKIKKTNIIYNQKK